MLKLSFILPCYNVEQYISDCLDSIYAQDMSEDEYEVICVNDCSTDGTEAVIAKFADRHKNLFYVNHEKNKGVGEARNSGLRVAHGEYIWFVDPDDEIFPNSSKFLYGLAKNKDVEILLFNYKSKKENIERKTFFDSEVLCGQNYVLSLFQGRFSEFSIVWRCLFKTSFLMNNAIDFPKISKAEDVSFLWKAMLRAKRVCSVEGVYYIHIDNPNSIAHNTIKANIAFSERIMFAYQIDVLLREENINHALVDDMLNTAKWCSNSSIELISRMTTRELSNYYHEIVSHSDEVDRVRTYMNKKYKLLFTVFLGRVVWMLKAMMICKLT